MSDTQYAGRRVDAWPYTGGYTGELSADLHSNAVCAGILKLSQRWVICLLTELGSVRFNPTRGTSFITRLRGGELRSEEDVSAAFLMSLDEMIDQMAAEETETTPDDERYASAELLSVGLTGNGKLSLTVAVRSAAGASRTVLVPISAEAL